MADDIKKRSNVGRHDAEADADAVLRKWTHIRGYLTLQRLQANDDTWKGADPAAPRHPPGRTLSADDKSALLTAGLALLVIAGAAFFAGLL